MPRVPLFPLWRGMLESRISRGDAFQIDGAHSRPILWQHWCDTNVRVHAPILAGLGIAVAPGPAPTISIWSVFNGKKMRRTMAHIARYFGNFTGPLAVPSQPAS